MYADYDFYKTTYGGGLTEGEFEAAERTAEANIRYLTYVKGDIFAKEDDNVKMAVCAAADVVNEQKKIKKSNPLGTNGIKSESNDGYSVSYITESKDGETEDAVLRRKISEAVRIYLLPTGWLSRVMSTRGGGCCI